VACISPILVVALPAKPRMFWPTSGAIAPRLRFKPTCTDVSKRLSARRVLPRFAFTFVPCSTELRACSACRSSASSRCSVREPPSAAGAVFCTVSVSIWMTHDAASMAVGSPEHGGAGIVVVVLCSAVTVVVVDAATMVDEVVDTTVEDVVGATIDVVLVDDLALVVVDVLVTVACVVEVDVVVTPSVVVVRAVVVVVGLVVLVVTAIVVLVLVVEVVVV